MPKGDSALERSLDPITICAQSPDGSLGAIVERGAEDPGVVIALSPTATATGLLLDEKGKPAAKQPLSWGRRVYLNPEKSIMSDHVRPKVVTDESGRFTLPSLVVGQDYSHRRHARESIPHGGDGAPEEARADGPGTLQVVPTSPSPDERGRGGVVVREGRARCRAVAPAIEATTLDGKPLTLEQFKGKFVLLDFWATWCGPASRRSPRSRPCTRRSATTSASRC